MSKINLTHFHNYTCDFGKIYPVGITEILPGDKVGFGTQSLIRVEPMLAPVMHPIKVDTYHFYAPTRLYYDDFDDFIIGKDVSSNPFPQLLASSVIGKQKLSDYLGISPTSNPNLLINAVPFRMYNHIWNEFFRDEDLQDEVSVLETGGLDNNNYDLLYANWKKDRFTTLRPSPQKGASVSVPVDFKGGGITSDGFFKLNSGGQVFRMYPGGSKDTNMHHEGNTNSNYSTYSSGLKLDADAGAGVNIADLRIASGLQRFQENKMMYGDRYQEFIKNMFGVTPQDGRIQNPTLIGHTTTTLQIGDVMQTSPADTGVLGSYAGKGLGIAKSKRHIRMFYEHGFLMTLVVIRPLSMYADGLQKFWSKSVYTEYYNRFLSHIGMSPILESELNSKASDPNKIFGYGLNFDDYRYSYNRVSAEMRPEGGVYNYFNLARNFSGGVALNNDFLKCVPSKRIFASQKTDPFIVMSQNIISMRRRVAKNPQPLLK